MSLPSPRFLWRRNLPHPKQHRAAAATVHWTWLGLVTGVHAAGLGLLLDRHDPGFSRSPPVMQVKLLADKPAMSAMDPGMQADRHRLEQGPSGPVRTAPRRLPTMQPPQPAQSKAFSQTEGTHLEGPAVALPQTQAVTDERRLTGSGAFPGGYADPSPAPSQQPLPLREAAYLENPAPGYPGAARRLGEEGTVVLRVHVLRDGRPREIEVLSSSGSARLDRGASDAVRHWRFLPAQRGDESVDSWLRVPIVFRLDP